MKHVALVLALSVACIAGTARAADWDLDPAASELGFVATFEKTPAPGAFRKFTASVRFDPERLPESRIDVVISVASADMRSDEVNRAIRGPDWFDVARHPGAEFHATDVRAAGGGRYVARGTLTVKAIARAVDVPISWKRDGSSAVMSGEVTVDRAAFGIGLGEWTSSKVIGSDVVVRFSLRLRERA
jgi:polyisoprenoid-binding protein YceI